MPGANGTLESSWQINGEGHRLEPVRGMTYDQSRPVFSSTSSWLLGRNLHPLDALSCELIERLDGSTAWGAVLQDIAEARGCSLDEVRDNFTPVLSSLCQERLVLLRTQ